MTKGKRCQLNNKTTFFSFLTFGGGDGGLTSSSELVSSLLDGGGLFIVVSLESVDVLTGASPTAPLELAPLCDLLQQLQLY